MCQQCHKTFKGKCSLDMHTQAQHMGIKHHVKNVASILDIPGTAKIFPKHVVSKKRPTIVHSVQTYFLLLVISIIKRSFTKRHHQNKPQPRKGKMNYLDYKCYNTKPTMSRCSLHTVSSDIFQQTRALLTSDAATFLDWVRHNITTTAVG